MMKIFLRILIVIAVLPIAIALFPLTVAYGALALHNCNRKRRKQVPATGFVRAEGVNLYDGEGRLMRFKGVNLGNWFVPEYWMCVMNVGSFETGVYTVKRADAAMRANPNLTEPQIRELYETYMNAYITEADFERIASLGLNTVRIPFCVYDLSDDLKTIKPTAFKYLDRAIDMCKKYGLYAVLDLHGAPGSQNRDFHSGNDSEFGLYGNAQNEKFTLDIWRAVAERYKNETAVAGYDLLNEPRKAHKKFGGKINFDFYDRLYHAVREIDADHLIIMECFTFPTHGARIKKYGWENVCIEYHIYNLTPMSQKFCLRFYNAAHNFMGYKLPVYIGEWNAFKKKSDWLKSLDYFERHGWSYTSWTYKTNKYFYSRNIYNVHTCNWGIYELDIPPVDLSTASYEDIRDVYLKTSTDNAAPSLVHEVYEFARDNDLL